MRIRAVKHRPRSTPCLADAIQLTRDLNLSPSSLEPAFNPPPWSAENLVSHFLPISKSSASANPLAANNIFLEFYNSLPPDNISVFCDGSCSPALKRSSAAFLIPALNVSRSWTLVPGSSILSAELSAIDSSLSFLYRAHEVYKSIFVFSDSKSAIQLLSSNGHSHPIAFNVLNTINLLKVRGISVSLVWIPSHVGILFNEQVDALARQEVISPSIQFENHLSFAEKILVVKHKLQSLFHADLYSFPSFHAKHRKKIGPASYLNARSRKISVALHRLRSGHNHLNSHRFKFDPQCQSPNCRNGCNAQENANHVLLICPFFDRERQRLRLLFTRLGIPFNLKNVLCLNDSIDKNSLLNIHYALSSFLIASKLINIV
jgi:ribonuclease HI